MPKPSRLSRYASPVDTTRYGEAPEPGGPRPPARFAGRVVDHGGSSDFTGRSGRYHLYVANSCPWSQQTVICHALAGLAGVVTVSRVDDEVDGRGWAFRERSGPDPVNGFTLLRQTFEAGEDGFDGQPTVPVLWDRATARLVSDDPRAISVDLATRFRRHAVPVLDTYPPAYRDEVEALDRWLRPAVNEGMYAAARPGPAGRRAAADLLAAFAALDRLLAGSRYLAGPVITQADVRLWVSLVRYDVGPNARRTINPGLHEYPHLWDYARDLYRLPAFRDSTDFDSFAVAGSPRPDWDAPIYRRYSIAA